MLERAMGKCSLIAVACSLSLSAFAGADTQTSFNMGRAGLGSRIRLAQNDVSSAALPTERASDSATLEEIVVTAQKRVERLQDVPISISVLEGATLDRSTHDLRDALREVPGITTLPAQSSGETQLAIRGITALGTNFQGGSPIGLYVDGAPLALIRSAVSPDLAVYDLERVEVLRGPQGTLYGANSANGVVRIVSQRPELSDFELKARAAYFDTADGGDSTRLDGAINVPLIAERLAFRGVVSYQDLAGWIDRPFLKDANRGERTLIRGILEARATDNLTIAGKVWRQRSDFLARAASTDQRTYGGQRAEPIDTTFDLYALDISYDLPRVSISSVSSYLEYFNRAELDYNYFFPTITSFDPFEQLVNITGGDSFVEEVNIASIGDGPWRWTAGAMFRDAKETFFQHRPSVAAPARFFDESQSYAVYGELTRSFLDGRLELLAGIRYFEEEQLLDEVSRRTVPPSATPNPPYFNSEATYDAWTPRFVVTVKPTSDLTFYASYSEGFRAGYQQNTDTLAQLPNLQPAEPDLLKNHELGSKGNLFGGMVSYDAAIFYIDWQDIQQNLLVQNFLPNGQFLNTPIAINGESASGLGYEVALTMRPVPGLRTSISYGYNDVTLDADVIGATGGIVYRDGDRLAGSAESTFAASAGYDFPITASLSGSISAAYARTSPTYRRAVVNGVSTLLASDTLSTLGVRASIASDQGWEWSVFGDNLTDEKGLVEPPDGFGPQFNGRLRPRTVGVQFEYRY